MAENVANNGAFCGQESNDRSSRVLKHMPDHFCTSSLQSDLLVPAEGIRGEGSLCCDTICGGSEYCRENRSNLLKKQKRMVDLWKEGKDVPLQGFCSIRLPLRLR